jgi:hypothetical protein
MGSTNGGHIRDCFLSGQIGVTTEDSVGNSSQNIMFNNIQAFGTATSGSTGFVIGCSGAMLSCVCTTFDIAYRVYGKGFSMSGCRAERNNTAFLFGKDSGNNDVGASGFSVISSSAEGNYTAVDFSGTCTGFILSSLTSIGHDSSNAGMTAGIQPSQYGIIVRADKAKSGIISGCGHGQWAAVAGMEVDAATSRTNLIIENCNMLKGSGTGGAVDWILPSNAYTAQFYLSNVSPVWTFSQLPSTGNFLEGDEFNVSDINSAWGTAYTGGGTTHGVVRRNNSGWTVMGV